MEKQKEIFEMLELLLQPGFCVRDHVVVKVNRAATNLGLTAGVDIRPLLLTGAGEYEALGDGCLYLLLSLGARNQGASVHRLEEADVFILDLPPEQAGFRPLALAARELRSPLHSAMTAADALAALPQTPELRQLLARLDQSLYRMVRTVGNMSDADGSLRFPQRVRNVRAVFDEIFQRAQPLAEQVGVTLDYEGLPQDLYSLLSAQQMERAVLNILSNALKFTPKGGLIQSRLTRQGRTLVLSIADNGPGIPKDIQSTLFQRYLRPGAVEDLRWGVGLGMVLIRSAATDHGGTVLVDQPRDGGTRVTVTLAIRPGTDGALKSPVFPVDYTGELDHLLVELSDSLPPSAYERD